jgi:hypothetical protein
MATCITHEPNHEVTGYYAPITGTFNCDVCGPYCTCNEDLANCELCDCLGYYDEMVLGANMRDDMLDILNVGNWDYVCMSCYLDKLPK